MPTLADIYSAADSFKRRLSDAAMNPGASLQQMLGYANDRAKVLNEMTAAAAEEKDLYGPASQALGRKLAEAYNPMGMVVYHGSPHSFAKFDLSKMGTGEGQQVYGKGAYLAQLPETAEKFRLPHKNFAVIKQNAPNQYDVLTKSGEKLGENVYYGAARKLKDEFDSSQQGNLYKVDLPDTHIRRMLDFDSPLKSQPKQVRDLAKSLGMDLNDLGGDLLSKVGKDEAGKQILEKAGIRGIKYYDQMKGGPDQWSRNYVVFDPNNLTILERNAEKLK